MDKTLNEALNDTTSITVDKANKIVVINDVANVLGIISYLETIDIDNISDYVVVSEQYYYDMFAELEENAQYPENATNTGI